MEDPRSAAALGHYGTQWLGRPGSFSSAARFPAFFRKPKDVGFRHSMAICLNSSGRQLRHSMVTQMEVSLMA